MSTTKAVNQLIKNDVINQVQKMLNHFEMYDFITRNSAGVFKFGFNTENLKTIVKNEWLLTNTVFCDHPAFQFKSLKSDCNLRIAFERVKGLVTNIPFSLVEISHNSSEGELVKLQPESENAVDFVRNAFKMCDGTSLKNLTFCSPENVIEFFHKQQRERKMWWRKFSVLPGRFQTTEISTDKSNNSQFVEIQAEFPWGLETIEHIRHFPEMLTGDSNFFEMKSQRKKFTPQVISCETSLEKIALTFLCDSYEELNEETDRGVLRFCRKLAPYKVAFAAQGNSTDAMQNLKELSLLLAKKIRKCGISVLLLPDVCSSTFEKQVLRNDGMGVPYTIFLHDRTLRDGIIDIRSRDTTLKEQSHVGLIVSYIEKLMKNY